MKRLDINKGDDVNHDCRSLLVAKRIKIGKHVAVVASTPLLRLRIYAWVLQSQKEWDTEKESGNQG